jgi:dipeptidyl aminopeptidase/acylaminoacyl peptidase
MRRHLAAFAVATVLIASACGSSETNEPAAQSTRPSSVAASPSATTSASPAAIPTRVKAKLTATLDASKVAGLEVPGYMEVNDRGELHVVNGAKGEILVLNAKGQVQRRLGKPGSKPGQFNFRRSSDPLDAIGGVAVAADGSLYVAEAGAKRVQHISAKGRPITAWGTKGSKDGQLLEPIGVAVGQTGEVYVVDDERNDIQVFSPAGKYLRTIGSEGSDLGQFSDTGNIRIDAEGNIVNADFGNGSVQAFDPKGKPLWTLGSPGSGPGEFESPLDVAFGPNGELLVVDDLRVQIFNAKRELVGVWPIESSGDHLAAVAVDGDRVWVEALFPDKLFQLEVSWES